MCLAFYEPRATVVEVMSRWDALCHMHHMPGYEQQLLALEALQIYAPLGYALGIGPISAQMEDLCFKVCIGLSYAMFESLDHFVCV